MCLVWGAFGGVCLREGTVNYLCVYAWMGEEFVKGWKDCFGGRGHAFCWAWRRPVKDNEFFWGLGWKAERGEAGSGVGGDCSLAGGGTCGAGKEGCPGCGGFPGV